MCQGHWQFNLEEFFNLKFRLYTILRKKQFHGITFEELMLLGALASDSMILAEWDRKRLLKEKE